MVVAPVRKHATAEEVIDSQVEKAKPCNSLSASIFPLTPTDVKTGSEILHIRAKVKALEAEVERLCTLARDML